MYKLVLIRHGQSEWNKTNRFTGWTDVDLTEQGRREAESAAKLLKEEGYEFDLAFTSVLTRAIRTLNIILDGLETLWIPVIKDWRLNERHYGDLQGLNKVEMAAEFGDEQVHIWRRSYDVPPPSLEKGDPRSAESDRRYAGLEPVDIPLTECLKDTVDRVVPYWNKEIVPEIKDGKRLIIAAHGNSLRGLVKHLDNISDDEIVKLNIPTGVPLVYELDKNLSPIKSYYLGDLEAIKAAEEAVKNQGKAK